MQKEWMKKVGISLFFLGIFLFLGFIFWKGNASPTGEIFYTAYPLDHVLPSGTYVVYAKTTILDRRDLESWEDDRTQTSLYRYRIGDTVPEKITDFVFENGESPTASVYKEGILMGNLFSADLHSDLTSKNTEAFVSLDGSVDKAQVPTSQVLFSKDGKTSVEYTIEYPFFSPDQIPYTVEMNISTDSSQKKTVTYSPQDLDIQTGYARPIVVSSDGKEIYLALTIESEGMFDPVPGRQRLWKYTIETGVFTDYSSFFQQNQILFYDFNSETEQVVGVEMELSKETNEFGFYYPIAPTTIHLFDLKTQQTNILLHDGDWTYEQVKLSDDGTQFAFNLGEDGVWVLPVQEQTFQSPFRQNPLAVADVSGKLVDWIGEVLLVDRSGELVLYNTVTHKTFSLDRDIGNYHVDQDYQDVWYIGSVRID